MSDTVLRPTADLSSRERSARMDEAIAVVNGNALAMREMARRIEAQQDQIAKLRAELHGHIASHRLSWPVTLWAHLRWMLGR